MKRSRGRELIDVTGSPSRRATVLVDGQRIAAISTRGRDALSDADRVDVSGLPLMPGLIDLQSYMGIVSVEDGGRMTPAVVAAYMPLDSRVRPGGL